MWRDYETERWRYRTISIRLFIMKKFRAGFGFALPIILGLAAADAIAQTSDKLPPFPSPLGVPKPGAATDAPYAPQPILPGGVVVTLFPPGSPYLKMDRVREPEQYNMSQTSPGRINNIVNIHNPPIEVHTVDRAINTGAAVILAAGGGHNSLNVGSEGATSCPSFTILA
jgi:hypothetical protein